MKTRDVLAAFNRGRISKRAMARTDVSRVALSAEEQTNWMPNTLGSMSLRPGTAYRATAAGEGVLIPFVNTVTDTAVIEMTAGTMRVLDSVSGTSELVTRNDVATTITNDFFVSNLTGWTDADEAGAASTWVAGEMKLLGTGYTSAIRRQEVTVAAEDQGVIHGVRVVVTRGPVLFRIGTTSGSDNLFNQAVLRTGEHSLAFNPPGASFWIEFESPLTYPVLIESCSIEAAGVMELSTPYSDADTCRLIRWQQSADVIFLACDDIQQRRIERRDLNSWSIVTYEANDGPYLGENTENIQLTPSGIAGEITLTASRKVFRSGHVGAIFKLASQGQLVAADLVAENTFTSEIRVTGVETSRIFQIRKAGTWFGTLSLQRSLGEPGTWVTVATYTANTDIDFDDGLDNSIAYYRIGFETGNYTSGTAECELEFSSGSISGVARVTAYTNATSVDAIVLSALGGTDATEIWSEGAWSDVNGWPTAVAISEGRLWWSGNGQNYGSVSDAFHSFDPEYVGDAGPINRRVGEGAVTQVNWLLPLQRLIVGTDGAEYSVRSNSLDEPISPTNYNSKAPSTKGSARSPADMTDGRGYFIGRNKKSLFELEYDSQRYDFAAVDVTLLCPEIGDGNFSRIATQDKPEPRVYVVRENGTAAVMIRDAAEDVLCWVDLETDGDIEDVTIIPYTSGDRVLFMVKRNIDGSNVRYIEEMARADQCVGGNLSRLADCHVTGTGSITGLDHLEGETVVIWGDGADQGTATVASGAVTGSYTNWCVGLPYSAAYKSAKLAGQTSLGLSLTQRTRIDHIGLILVDTHAQGLQFGPDADNLDDLPLIEAGTDVDADYVWDSYDADMIEFPGEWSTDNRLYLTASAPRPVTVCAAVLSIERNDKA